MDGGRGVVRILALLAVAAAPTALVLQGLRSMGALALSAACLGLGYCLLRMRGAHPVPEGAWLGLAIGGGIGLAYAMAAHEMALGLCPDPAAGCDTPPLAGLRAWMIAAVATSGIGLAAGFLANYDRHSRDLRERRAAAAVAGAPRAMRVGGR